MKVGITGVHGLIGFHLHSYLHSKSDVQVVGAGREVFRSQAALDDFLSGVDVVFHLAGMNRGDDSDIEATNIGLAAALVNGCRRLNRRPHILFASSTHVSRDTAYARSKRESTRLFGEWAAGSGAVFSNFILPHVFGEGGKPFYNSVVSTFCHQLATGTTPAVIHDGELELIHALQVAEKMWEVALHPIAGDVVLAGQPMRVSELLSRLKIHDANYRNMIVPDVRAGIDLCFFNTYRSYLFPRHYPVALQMHNDARGTLFESVKSLDGGQCFISTSKPGITRGNHYHLKKIERFVVIGGQGLIKVRKLFSDEIVEFEVDGEHPQYIDIPTMHTHNITNIGPGDMLALFWANEIFDPLKPDTYPEPVQAA